MLRKGVVPNQNLPDYEDPVKKEKRLKREARYFQRNVLMEAKRVELEAERSAPLVKTEPYDFINCGPVVKEEPPDSPDIEEEPPDSPDIVKEELSTIYQISDDQVSKCDQNNSSVIARQQLKISWDSHVKQEGLGLLFFGSDWKLNFYTGLHALTLLDSIEKAIKNLDQFKNPPREISLRNRIILVFMRMKTDLSFTQLAKVFAVADERVAEYFFETVRFLRAALDFAVRWPIVENNTDQPYHFFPKYVETFVKLDCPSDHLKYFKCQNCRILLHSKHNGELTAKYLIGVAASGLICYCGDGHFVQASDNHVYNAEKVRRHISFGLTVRADKDFFMDDSLRANYSQLCRPPFLVKKKIKSSEVNVEKAIKRFNIFNNSFRKYLVGVMDDLIFIACAVSNLNRM